MARASLGANAHDRGLDITVESAGLLEGDRPVPSSVLDVIGGHLLTLTVPVP